MRELIGVLGVVFSLGALWTGAQVGHHFKADMWGFLPPHYGYSAYFESAALLCAPWWPAQALCAVALGLSTCRAAWVGAAFGWAFLGRSWARWAALPFVLLFLVQFGASLKPTPFNDRVRQQIWREAEAAIATSPQGVGEGHFTPVVLGRSVGGYAHSDVLQAIVEDGWVAGGTLLFMYAVLLVLALLEAPRVVGATLLCLCVQSVVDNRLHYLPCAALWTTVWLWAAVRSAQERAAQAEEPGFLLPE